MPEPQVHSYVHSGARRTVETPTHTEEFYPLQYATDGSLLDNLKFALKNEALDLRIIFSALKAIGKPALEQWVCREPTGAYSRRAWFLYERFSGDTLSVPDCRSGNYVDALDAERHYVAEPLNSKRHRVRDNLLGNGQLCPTVRRSTKLKSMMDWDLSSETHKIAQLYTKETIARALSILYTKETRSSFAIEGEVPSSNREERFLLSLRAAPAFLPADESKLVKLQGNIVDPRYAAQGWRRLQNFVGETTRNFGQHVHFVCPKPEDVAGLMSGWMEMTGRLLESSLDPVIAAALCAFSFVFVHPFEDGNGRLHRFLVHAFLASRKFGPPGMILPISAAILRQRAQYENALEQFSRPIMTAIDWTFSGDDALQVHNETRDLYRFFDATPQAEFLYEKLAEAIRTDFKEEAEFLEVFDAALSAVRRIVDMPDKKASLLVRHCLEQQGRLSKNKRGQFNELSSQELEAIEARIQEIVAQRRP